MKLGISLLLVIGALLLPAGAPAFENFEPSPHPCGTNPNNERVWVSYTSARYTHCEDALMAIHHYIASAHCIGGNQYCTLTHIHWGCNTKVSRVGSHVSHHTTCARIGHAAEAHFSWHFR
jgi:hypothetical protein